MTPDSTSKMGPVANPTTNPIEGTWRASVMKHGGDEVIPFGLIVHQDGSGWRAEVQNANELIPMRMTVVESRFRIDLDPYQSWIEGTVGSEGATMIGEWIRPRGNRPTVKMSFVAEHGIQDLFPNIGEPEEFDPKIDGRWAVQFQDEHDPSVGIFETVGERVHGTFLTTLGDYRFLDGEFDGKRLSLSCFDGAHAFLFRAELQDDGSLKGRFLSRDSYEDQWTARRDEQAQVPDPFGLTKVLADAQTKRARPAAWTTRPSPARRAS